MGDLSVKRLAMMMDGNDDDEPLRSEGRRPESQNGANGIEATRAHCQGHQQQLSLHGDSNSTT